MPRLKSILTSLGSRRWLVSLSMMFALYVGSYAVLSACGRYVVRPLGERRWPGTGMAVMDTSLWTPAGVRWERRRSVTGNYVYESDPLGWLFLPLLSLDRRYVHPTRDLLEMH